MPLDYPVSRQDPTADVLHGETIADPYRWLEDTASAETAEWVKLQNEVTDELLATLPDREAIRARLTAAWDFPRRGVPFEFGGRWFQTRNTGLQSQDVLYVMSTPDDEGRVLIDPNTLSSDGTVALSAYQVSSDGRQFAYATSEAGSDWMTWRVRDIETGEDRPDVLEWSKFSGAVFDAAGESLYYVALDAPQAGREFLEQSRIPRLMRHRFGTPQSADELVFTDRAQPEWIIMVEPTYDGRFLILNIGRGTFPENRLHVLDLYDDDASLVALASDFSAQVQIVGHVEETFFLVTDDGAERRRIVAVEVSRAGASERRAIVAESDETLLGAQLVGGRLLAHYLVDAHSRLRLFSLDGTFERDIELPGIVTVAGVAGEFDDPTIHFGMTSFTDAGSIWRHDLDSGATTRVFSSTPDIDTGQLATTQAFVSSDDGTRIPVFLIHRRDVTPTGEVPTILYGYGGFEIPLTPAFSVARAIWVERGGLYAVANLRGGGEYGKAWYDAGRLANKQNVFDDFCAVARWLGGDSGWSRASRIAIHGGSNGGLLVGACLTQHPELFGAAIPAVGVLDMLRFHKFTVGWAWVSDYGDPDDAEAFRWLRAYSPLHNIRPGASYPPTLVLTGDHDDRVAPGHSFKFAAALQAAQAGEAPVLIRIETSAGHGAGKPTQKIIDEAADLLTFAGWATRQD